MLYVKILPPILKNDEVHTRTIVEVSDKEDFSNLLINDDKDTQLLSRSYSISLIVGKPYYIRVRFYLSPGGLQRYSDTKTFYVTDSKDTELLITPPIFVGVPGILTNIPGIDDFPTMYLNFSLNSSTVPLEAIKRVDWFLFDTDNKLIYDVSDNNGLTSIFTIRKHLELDSVYIVKVSVTTITNTTSDLGSYVFKTHSYNNLIDMNSIVKNRGIPIKFNIFLVNSYTMEIYNARNELIFSESSSATYINLLDKNINIEDIAYLRITDTSTKYWNYLYRDSATNTAYLPFYLPANL